MRCLRVIKCIETERMVVACGRGRGRYCSGGTKFHFCKMQGFWKWMVPMRLHRNVNIPNTAELYT